MSVLVSPKLKIFGLGLARITIISVFFCGAGLTSLRAQDVRVEDLQFEGNDDLSAGKLSEAIVTEANPWSRFFLFWKASKIFDKDAFLHDLLRLEKFYHQEGYLDALVKNYELNYNEEGDEVNIVIHIEEGEPTIVEGVDFGPSNGIEIPFSDAKLRDLVTLKKGRRYREEELRLDYDKLVAQFNNHGYPYIEARLKPDIDDQENKVVLHWILNPGELSNFGKISIHGNNSVSDDLIHRGLEFKEGDIFAQKDLQTSQNQIYRLELFQYVNLEPTDHKEKPTNVPISVQLNETDLRSIELGVGYGSEEAVRLRGNWTHRNFLGGARILRIEAKRSTRILPISLELELSQPFFFDNQNDLIVKPFFYKQDEKSFEARRIGVQVTFARQITRRTNFYVSTRTSRDSVRVKGAAAVIADSLDDYYNKSILSTGIRRNTTDLNFTPTRGYALNFNAEEAGRVFQSRFQYYKFSGEFRTYHQIEPEYILALRLFAGSMNPYGGSAFTPVEERFFAGGSYSVRGWARQQIGPQAFDEENNQRTPLGGDSKLEGSAELRYPIIGSFRGALFLDAGNIWQDWLAFDLLDLNYAAGAGLRYSTPIGPVRVDFAWKLNKQNSQESNYQIHLSIGQAF